MIVLKIVGIVLLVLVVIYLLAIMPRMVGRADFEPFKGRYYAHRGLHDNESDAPENSMKAFAKAVDAGYGIELDVQLTKDEQVVVCHDFDLKRICGEDVKVRDLTYEQLQEYGIYGTEEKIPLFSDVLKLVDGKVPLIIEYKVPGLTPRVCELAHPMLEQYKGLYCIESFHPFAVLWYRRNHKEILRGILSDSYIKEGLTLEFPKILYIILHHLMMNCWIKPDFIAYNKTYYKDPSRVLCYKLFRAPAVAYTIKSQKELDDRRRDYDIFIFEGFIPEK